MTARPGPESNSRSHSVLTRVSTLDRLARHRQQPPAPTSSAFCCRCLGSVQVLLSATTSADPSPGPEAITDRVRANYAESPERCSRAASPTGEASNDCCTPAGTSEPIWGELLYDATDRASLPDAAVLASLGCGNPTAVAELRPGEVVLDLGSGGGIDVLLSAQRVGPTGFAYGLDMTDEMLELARRNAADAGATNVEFRKGRIEAIPLRDASVDVVISNCVINLSADKAAVLAEIARVLRPGGRIGISDVVADDALAPAERAERGSFVGCIAGALSFAEYRPASRPSASTDIAVTPTHAVADGLHGAIVRATKPAGWTMARHPDRRSPEAVLVGTAGPRRWRRLLRGVAAAAAEPARHSTAPGYGSATGSGVARLRPSRVEAVQTQVGDVDQRRRAVRRPGPRRRARRPVPTSSRGRPARRP